MPVTLPGRLVAIVTAGFLAALSAPVFALSGGVSALEVMAAQGGPPYTAQQLAIASAVSGVTVPLLAFDATGRPTGLCSATVVHPRVVLTAAHCAVIGSRFVVLFENGAGVPARRQSIGVAIHPEFLRSMKGSPAQPDIETLKKALGKSDAEFLTSDLALILLHRPIPETHAVVEMVPAGFRDELGTGKVIAGYGQVDATAAITKPVLRFADLRGNTRDLRGVVGGGGEIVMESRYQSGARVNVCSGDSGGPIFVLDRGSRGLRQIAVASAADLRCREFAIYAPIDRQRAVLRRMFDTLMTGRAGRGTESVLMPACCDGLRASASFAGMLTGQP